MRFEPTLPDETVNVAGGSAAREAALLIVGVAGATALISLGLVLAVELVVPLVPPSLEARWFAGFGASLTAAADDDAEADERTARVQAVLDRLATHWPDASYERFGVAVIEDESPNAFALPGGAVIVTSALLDRIESENELAFVLAHELGHFAGRDHLRGLGRALALGVVFAAVGLEADALGTLTGTASALSTRHFDRGQESGADAFGLELVVAEYGHAAGAGAVFERILVAAGDEVAAADRSGTLERTASYLSTHPLGEDRILALGARAAREGWELSGPTTVWAR